MFHLTLQLADCQGNDNTGERGCLAIEAGYAVGGGDGGKVPCPSLEED